MRFNLTRARLGDLDVLVEHRLNMWRDIHPESEPEIEKSRAYTKKWVREKLPKGELIAFIARAPDGRMAGSGCIWLREEQPRPANPLHRLPYLMSMYAERELRRKGVANLVLRRALKWSRGTVAREWCSTPRMKAGTSTRGSASDLQER